MKRSVAMRLIAAALVLLGAYALGLGIRKVRMQRAGIEAEPSPQAEFRESRPAAPADAGLTDTAGQDEESPLWPDEEPAETEEAHASIEEDRPQAERETVVIEDEDPTAKQSEQTDQSVGDWRSVWANLDLTEEEQLRLREGLRLGWERWQNMSPQAKEAEASRLRAMGERWQGMSDEERQEASQRMRDRFEQWRQSADAELPELRLD